MCIGVGLGWWCCVRTLFRVARACSRCSGVHAWCAVVAVVVCSADSRCRSAFVCLCFSLSPCVCLGACLLIALVVLRGLQLFRRGRRRGCLRCCRRCPRALWFSALSCCFLLLFAVLPSRRLPPFECAVYRCLVRRSTWYLDIRAVPPTRPVFRCVVFAVCAASFCHAPSVHHLGASVLEPAFPAMPFNCSSLSLVSPSVLRFVSLHTCYVLGRGGPL